MSLSWVVGSGSECLGGKEREPSWVDVELRLRELGERSGSVTLESESISGYELVTLQVVAENGLFAMTLGEDNGEDYIVRSYLGGNPGSTINVLGDAVDSSEICMDIEIVIHVFQHFFDSGHVPQSLMA